MKFITIVSLIIFSLSGVYGQNQKKDSIHYTLSGTIMDFEGKDVIIGALVSIILQSDTLHTQTDEKGYFSIKTQNIPQSIEITSLGYGITRIATKGNSTVQDYGIIKMDVKSYHLDEIEIRARLKKVTHRGDTIQFNAKAFDIKKWDTAGDLLEKMPGLDVNKKSGTVSYENKPIKKAYVDGKQVFGEGTGNLMEYMDATDINTVDLYKELSDENKQMGNTNAEKDWVMNFKTFNQLVGTSVAQIEGSYGRDEKRNVDGKIQDRYIVGAALNDFSEKRQLQIKYLGNNLNRETSKLDYVTSADQLKPGYNRSNVIDFGFGIRKENSNINIAYTYNNEYDSNDKRSQRIYTPTDEYYSRLLSDTTSSVRKSQIHNLNISGSQNAKNKGVFYNIKSTLTDENQDNRMFNSSLKNDELISSMRNLRISKTTSFSGNYMINPYFSSRSGKLRYSLATVASVNRNKREETQNDSIFQNIYRLEDINTNTKTNSLSLSMSPRVSYKILSTLDIIGTVRLSTNRSDKTKDAIENDIQQIIPSQSYNFVDRSKALSPIVTIIRQKKNHFLSLEGLWNWTWVGQESNGISTLPEKRFNAPILNIVYQMNNALKSKKQSTLTFFYKGQTQVPVANMLQGVIDNSNPLYLRSGNVNLKQAYIHTLSSSLNWQEEERYVNYSFTALYTKNRIVPNKTLFFDKETVLSDYNNYIAPAGSTLSTYDNVDDTYSLKGNIDYHTPIYLIYCNLKSNLSYSYDRSSEFLGLERIKTNLHSGQLTLDLKSDFSNRFDFGIKSQSNYYQMNRSNNTKNRILEESIETSANAYFFDDRLFLSAFYSSRFIRNFDYDINAASTNIINFTAGSKLLHRRNAQISISVFDILNKNRNFNSQANATYLVNTWEQISGRYFMLNFSYQFKIKRTKKSLRKATETNENNKTVPLMITF